MNESGRGLPDDRRSARLRWLGASGVALLVAGYLVVIPFGLVRQSNRLSVEEIVLAISLFVILAFFAQTSYSIRNFSLGSGGFTAEFDRIDARQSALESEVRALQVAISGMVTKFEIAHLEKLAADGPAVVRFGEIMISELTHLDAMQFLRPKGLRGLNALRQDHGSGLDDFDLKEYVEITKEGLEYIILRTRLVARTTEERTQP